MVQRIALTYVHVCQYALHAFRKSLRPGVIASLVAGSPYLPDQAVLERLLFQRFSPCATGPHLASGHQRLHEMLRLPHHLYGEAFAGPGAGCQAKGGSALEGFSDLGPGVGVDGFLGQRNRPHPGPLNAVGAALDDLAFDALPELPARIALLQHIDEAPEFIGPFMGFWMEIAAVIEAGAVVEETFIEEAALIDPGFSGTPDLVGWSGLVIVVVIAGLEEVVEVEAALVDDLIVEVLVFGGGNALDGTFMARSALRLGERNPKAEVFPDDPGDLFGLQFFQCGYHRG